MGRTCFYKHPYSFYAVLAHTLCLILLNFLNPGGGGGDNTHCYFVMAKAVLDDEPNTIYSCDYTTNKGVVYPLVYAILWKVTHRFVLGDMDAELDFIRLVVGPFFTLFGLYLMTCRFVKSEILRAIIPIGMSLTNPFFEVINHGFIDSFYLFLISCGVVLVFRKGTLSAFMLGLIMFLLPMTRTNGIFFTLAVLAYFTSEAIYLSRLRRRVPKEVIAAFASFICLLVAYESFVGLSGWAPSKSVAKHFPIYALYLGEDTEYWETFYGRGYFSGFGASWILEKAIVRTRLMFVVKSNYDRLGNVHGRIFDDVVPDTEPLKNTTLFLVFLALNAFSFVKYAVKGRDKTVFFMYFCLILNIIVQSFIHYEARYFVFSYYVMYLPVFLHLDRALKEISKKAIPAST